MKTLKGLFSQKGREGNTPTGRRGICLKSPRGGNSEENCGGVLLCHAFGYFLLGIGTLRSRAPSVKGDTGG